MVYLKHDAAHGEQDGKNCNGAFEFGSVDRTNDANKDKANEGPCFACEKI